MVEDDRYAGFYKQRSYIVLPDTNRVYELSNTWGATECGPPPKTVIQRPKIDYVLASESTTCLKQIGLQNAHG